MGKVNKSKWKQLGSLAEYNTTRRRSSYLQRQFHAHKLISIYRCPQKKNNVSICELINSAIRSPLQKIGHGIDSHGQMDTQCLKITDIKGATFAQQKARLSFDKWRFLYSLGDERECPQLALEIRTKIRWLSGVLKKKTTKTRKTL